MTRLWKIAFPSASRTATTYYSEEFSTELARGVRLFTNPTAGSGTLVVTVQHKDPISGTWADVTGASSSSISGTTMHVLTVHPQLTASANVNIAQPLSPSFRVKAVVATNPLTFSCAAVLTPN